MSVLAVLGSARRIFGDEVAVDRRERQSARSGRLLGAVEVRPPYCFATSVDAPLPLPVVRAETNADVTGRVVRLLRPVEAVLGVRYVAEIGEPVVGRVSVDVVYLSIGPRTILDEPRYPMRQVEDVIDTKRHHSVVRPAGQAARRLPRAARVPASTPIGAISPKKNSGGRLVPENRTNVVGRQGDFSISSHTTNPRYWPATSDLAPKYTICQGKGD